MATKNNEAKIRFTAETKDFNAALKQVSSNTTELKSEMKLIEAQMKNNGTTIDGLQKKHDNLSAQLKENENKQEALNNKLEVATRLFGENSNEAQKLRTQLNNARTEHEKLSSAVSDCAQEMNRLREETVDTRTASEKLNDTINDQQSELDRLKSQYRDVILEQGRGSDAANELERQITDLNEELEDNKKRLKDADKATNQLTDSLDDAGNAAESAEGGFTVFKATIADLASNAIQSAIGAIGDFVSSLWNLADETREFRQDMGTLETAFKDVGFGAQTATETWKDLYAIFGEDDRAVEAANNISRMAKSEEELNQWTNILTGVWGKYQDALPVEGLAEAAGETAKVGKVTGGLADALNWSSEAAVMFADYMSEDVTNAEDAFNVALSECTNEQERQALITDTLTALYGDAAEEYKNNSASVMENNRANAEAALVQAELAEAIEPVNTLWTEMKTELLEAVTPAIKTVAEAVVEVINWFKEHEKLATLIATAIGIVTVAITALSVALVAATIANNAFITSLLANPVTGIVMAIIAALVALGTAIAAVVIYWDEIKAAMASFWDSIMGAISAVGDWFYEVWTGMIDWFSQAWSDIVTWWNGLWQSVSGWFTGIIEGFKTALSSFWQSIVSSPIVQWFTELFNSIYNTFASIVKVIAELIKGTWEIIKAVWSEAVNWFNTNVITPIKNFFTGLWDTVSNAAKSAWSSITGVFKAAGNWFSDTVVKPITNVFSNAWNTVKNGAQGAYNGVKSVFSNLAKFFGDIFSSAWNKVKAVFSTGGAIFSGITEGITNMFKSVVNTIIKGINKVVAIPFNAINKVLTKLRNFKFLELQPFSGLPSISVPQIPLLAKGGIVDRATLNIAGEAGTEAIAPIDKLQGYIEDAVNAAYGSYNIATLVAAVEDLADRAIQLNINGKEFATATAGDTDSVNGRRVGLRTRGLATT